MRKLFLLDAVAQKATAGHLGPLAISNNNPLSLDKVVHKFKTTLRWPAVIISVEAPFMASKL